MRRRIVMLCLLLAWAAARAAADATYVVQVHLPDERSLDNAPLRVFARRDRGWEPLPCVTIERQKQRDFGVTLPRGQYAVEIGASHPGGVTLLRDSTLVVPKRRSVDLNAVRLPVNTPIDGRPGDVKQIAARCSGNGEFRWAEVQPNAVNLPDFLLSPGEPYLLSACGETDSTLTVVWKPATPREAGPIEFADSECNAGLTVAAARGTPALKECFVDVAFPDAFVRLSNALSGRRLRTNRPRAMVGYTLKTQAGQTLAFSRRGMTLGKATTLTVGRPPKAALLADVMFEDKRDDPPRLFTQVFLIDAGGRTLDYANSDIGYHETLGLRQRNGVVTSIDRDFFTGKAVPSESFTARVEFRYGTPQRIDVRGGGGWVDRASTHFDFNAPAALNWRADAYLQSLERAYAILTRLTGRPPPTWFPVQWKSIDNGISVAGIGRNNGSNDNIWMLYPYTCLQQCEPLREPGGIIVHEMLHNFGYDHGDEMSRLQKLGQAEFDAMRWAAVDTGQWAIWAE